MRMRRIPFLTLALVLSFPLFAVESPTMDEVQRLMSSRRYRQAAEALEEILQAQPDNGMAWFELGRASNLLGNYDRSVEASRKAAEFPRVRPSAYYNMACAFGLKGDRDEARLALGRALESGFLDFDLLATDPDLEILRRESSFPLPKSFEYETYRGHGTKFRYRVILPSNFDEKASYPALFAFPPGQGVHSANWMLENLWGGETGEKGWIVVVPVAPDDGWWTHPFHHGMEALLSSLKRKYRIEGGKFHLVGFAAGSAPALTYSRMSARYFQSFSTASSYNWVRWSDEDLLSFSKRGIPVHLFVGEADESGVEIASRVKRVLTSGGGRATLVLLEKQDHRLNGFRNGGMIPYLAEAVASVPANKSSVRAR